MVARLKWAVWWRDSASIAQFAANFECGPNFLPIDRVIVVRIESETSRGSAHAKIDHGKGRNGFTFRISGASITVAVLKVLQGSCPGQILEMRGERMVFGRHPNCQIVLDNAAVSRHHAQILKSHGTYYLEDLRSRNGTQLNGVDIQGKTELHDSDEVKVCDFVFCFQVSPPPDLDHINTREPSQKSASKRNQSASMQPLTADTDPSVMTPQEVTIADDSDRSSIITTLEARSSSGLRLGVNPEVKLRTVIEISTALGSVLDLNEVLKKILDGLFKIYPQADEGFILLKDPVTQRLAVKATKDRDLRRDDVIPISMTIVRQAMESCKAILSANAADDSRFNTSESLSNLRIRSMMCAPLVGKGLDALGVIQLTTRDLRLQFSQDDLDLLISVASQGALAIDNASLHEEVLNQALKQRDLERELEFANQVQLGFLPHERPDADDYEFHDYYAAAQSVGGDYFDYIPLGDHKIAVALADVAGKGVPAALLMARLYSSARLHLITKSGVGAAMSGLNGEIALSGLGHRFITCVMAIIDTQTHTVTLANAGHLPPIRRHDNRDVEIVSRKDSGMPLGIVPDQQFREFQFDIAPGDSWVLYTDGVTEAMSPDRELYLTKRLTSCIANSSPTAESLVKGIVTDVEKFCAGMPQRDDICLVGFRRIS